MKAPPANVASTDWSLKILRNCTSGASSDPWAAEAITHPRAVGVTVTVVRYVRISVDVDVVVVPVVVTLMLVEVEVHDVTVRLVTVGENVVVG